DDLPLGLQCRFQRPPRRAFIGKFWIAQLFQIAKRRDRAVKVLLGLRIKLLWSVFKVLIKDFRLQLAFFDRRSTLLFRFVGFRVGLVTQIARLLIIDDAIRGFLDDGKKSQRQIELCTDKSERRRTSLRITVFEFGINRVPELFDQSVTKREAVAQ